MDGGVVSFKGTIKLDWRASTTSDLRRAIRTKLAPMIRDLIRNRVRLQGMGADAKLAGYHEGPLVVDENRKKKKSPSGGLPKFYKGGYKQYRKDVGLEEDKFVLENTGALWRDWRHFPIAASTEPLLFGFGAAINDEVAEAAMKGSEKGPRDDMFDLNQAELDSLGGEALELVLDKIWGVR